MPLYYVGYNGMPRRYHDYPTIFMGWQSLASLGHVINILSIFIFIFVLFESKLTKRPYVHYTYGVPRFNKRINYYIYKISNIKFKNKNLIFNYNIYKNIF